MWRTTQVEGIMQVTVAREVAKKDSCCRLTILIAPKMTSFHSFSFALLLSFVSNLPQRTCATASRNTVSNSTNVCQQGKQSSSSHQRRERSATIVLSINKFTNDCHLPTIEVIHKIQLRNMLLFLLLSNFFGDTEQSSSCDLFSSSGFEFPLRERRRC